MKIQANNGFTLIEILVVVIIISILTVMGVQMVNSGSVERNLQQHGRILLASINYACDQATFQNRPVGVKLYLNAYTFADYANQQWLDLVSSELNNQELNDGSVLSLKIDDTVVLLKDEELEIPQILCDSSGQLTPFEIIISDATNGHHYQLKTKDFWTIEGQWLDAK